MKAIEGLKGLSSCTKKHAFMHPCLAFLGTKRCGHLSTDWPLLVSLEESNIYIAGSNSRVGIVQSTYLDVIFCIYDVSGSVVYYNTYI